MDEASRIVADLRRKLDELNYKVVQYRHDMFSEFERHKEDILRNVTQDVSSEVTKAIAVSLKDYPALLETPDCSQNDSNQTPTENTKDLRSRDEPSPQIPSTTSNANVMQDEPPRSPHEREREFTGVFTPSYLPLLDSTDRHERRPSEDMSTNPQESKAGKTHYPNLPVMQTVIGDPSNPSTPTVQLHRPPTPLRKNTDTSVTSNGSDSDSTLRKSALRRKSSTGSHSILSPRKVRFALEGQEYPTDSTPEPPIIEEDPPVPKQQTIILPYWENLQSYAENVSDDEEAGSEQVENIEDIEEPPPKRISSSQALRVLSRGPLEEDIKWTAVAAPPDGSASVPVDQGMLEGKAYIDADDENAEENETLGSKSETDELENKKLGKLSQAEFDDSSPHEVFRKDMNERLASNPHLTSSTQSESSAQSKMKGISTQQEAPSGPSQASQSSTARTPLPVPKRKNSTFSLADSDSESESETEQHQLDGDGDVDMFEFEDEGRNKKENNGAKKNPDLSPLSPSDVLSPRSISGFRQADTTHGGTGSSLRSGSLGGPQSIGTGGMFESVPRATDQVVVGTPSGIDYSYKGTLPRNHPFNQPIVSERVQREARQLGDIKSWVGSVDGRSGIDDRPGDSGFRGSLGGMSSSLREGAQPRSFSERFIIEEEMSKAKGKKR